MNKVVLELTKKEARALVGVVGNGWGDGDYSDYLNDSHESMACKRAMEKLNAAAYGKPTTTVTDEPKPVAWLHAARPEADVITDAVKNVWENVPPRMEQYSIPLYTREQLGTTVTDEQELNITPSSPDFTAMREALVSQYHSPQHVILSSINAEDLREAWDNATMPLPAPPMEDSDG